MRRYVVNFEESAQADYVNRMIGVGASGASTKHNNGFVNFEQRFQNN